MVSDGSMDVYGMDDVIIWRTPMLPCSRENNRFNIKIGVPCSTF